MNADISRWSPTGNIELNLHPGFCNDADILAEMHERQAAGEKLVLVRHHGLGPEDSSRGRLRPDYYTLESKGSDRLPENWGKGIKSLEAEPA